MGEHFVIKNIRRSIAEAQSRKGMIVGLPEIRIPASHAEVLLGEIDRLNAEIEIYKAGIDVCNPESVLEAESRYLDDIERLKAELEELQSAYDELRLLADGRLSIKPEYVRGLERQLAEARAEVERYRSRDGKASVTFSFEAKDYPFNFEDLEIVDFGVSDNRYVVAAPKAISQAHRAAEESAKDAFRRGWEQAKREAVKLANTLDKWGDWESDLTDSDLIANAIAAMKYKEPAK